MLLPRKKVISNVLEKELDKHLEIEDQLFSLFNLEEIDIHKLTNIVNEFKKIRNMKMVEGKILVQEKKLDTELVTAYNQAQKEISSVYTVMTKGEIPTLNLDIIQNFIFEFSKIDAVEQNEENEDYEQNKTGKGEYYEQLAILTNQEKGFPLVFKNGEKTILSRRDFNLSEFKCDELVEILKFLDIMISDESYDYLRTEIAKRIASISK